MSQIIVSLIIIISLLAGGAHAIQAAGPGDLLYNLDRNMEKIQLRMTKNAQKEVSLRLQHATERLEEALQKLNKGQTDDALMALEMYNQAMSKLEEYIENDNGLNRQAMRAMLQEQLAQQSGLLDRLRLHWPEDAQARNAYQKAFQRTNMGADSLIGPPETAPQGSTDEDMSQGSNQDVPQGPNQDTPQGPNQDAPQGPNQDAPQGPNQDAPQGPNQDTPQDPNQDAPQDPNQNAPQDPNQDAPHGPNDDPPQGPNDDAPNGPSNNRP